LKLSKILLSLVVFLSLSISGCANVGNQSVKDLSEAEANKQIVRGVTTKNDIKESFGSPMESTFTDGGLTIWTYQYDDTSAFTAETVGSVVLTLGLAGTKARGTRNELVILFDEQNIVKQFNMSNSPIEAGTGIF
jgi:outer membrane protein assembly factor BamE (lipoprotein component of BamABCDE complex)